MQVLLPKQRDQFFRYALYAANAGAPALASLRRCWRLTFLVLSIIRGTKERKNSRISSIIAVSVCLVENDSDKGLFLRPG
jgi:hypothetical protein